VTVLIVKFIK